MQIKTIICLSILIFSLAVYLWRTCPVDGLGHHTLSSQPSLLHATGGWDWVIQSRSQPRASPPVCIPLAPMKYSMDWNHQDSSWLAEEHRYLVMLLMQPDMRFSKIVLFIVSALKKKKKPRHRSITQASSVAFTGLRSLIYVTNVTTIQNTNTCRKTTCFYFYNPITNH